MALHPLPSRQQAAEADAREGQEDDGKYAEMEASQEEGGDGSAEAREETKKKGKKDDETSKYHEDLCALTALLSPQMQSACQIERAPDGHSASPTHTQLASWGPWNVIHADAGAGHKPLPTFACPSND